MTDLIATSIDRDGEHRKDLTNRERFSTVFKCYNTCIKRWIVSIVRQSQSEDPIQAQHNLQYLDPNSFNNLPNNKLSSERNHDIILREANADSLR
jgi:hypothetical protein